MEVRRIGSGGVELKVFVGFLRELFRVVLGVGVFGGLVAVGVYGPGLVDRYPVIADVMNYGLYGIAGLIGLVVLMLVITFAVVEPMNAMRERRERKREVRAFKER